jgi:hypothetical protein
MATLAGTTVRLVHEEKGHVLVKNLNAENMIQNTCLLALQILTLMEKGGHSP